MDLTVHLAAMTGNLEEVKRLIDQDPEVVNSRDLGGKTPLHYASYEGHLEVVACLLDNGAQIDQQTQYGGCTACYLACGKGHPSVVELLLGKGADPIIPGYDGLTPLIIASLKGHVDVVRCLLKHHQAMSTLNHCDENGRTALYCACHKGHGGVVRLLLEAGADPTIATNNGWTPMDIAREEGKNDCVELLEEWERHHLLTKARHLRDASHDDDVSQALAHQPSSSSSSSSATTTAKRARVKATPTYLRDRVEKEKPLPEVEVEVAIGGGGEGDKANEEIDEGLLVKVVLGHVVCGGLTGELFVELMEVMGMTGYRKDRKEGGANAAAGGGGG